MKKAIFGGTLMLSGFIATALLMLGRMMSESAKDAINIIQGNVVTLESRDFIWIIYQGQIVIPFALASIIALLGLALCIWSLGVDRSNVMNRLIVGCGMLMSSIISATILFVGRMIAEENIATAIAARFAMDGMMTIIHMPSLSIWFLRDHRQAQLPFAILAIVAILGLTLCIWTLVEERTKNKAT